MISFLTYDIKAAVLIAVFYIFYRLLLSKETLHRMNRIVLLSTAVLSLVLPLCIITTHRTEIIAGLRPTIDVFTGQAAIDIEQTVPSIPWWQTAIVTAYLIGVAIIIGKILISLISIMRLIHSAQDVREYKGSRLIISDENRASFSWMNYIIIGRNDYEQGIEEILDHEKAHIGLRHSWDILLVDLISAIQWFNPAIWMLRSDLRAIHEYEADEAVLLKGVDVRHYQYLLVSKAMADSGFSITNQFNHSNLKQRINMMTSKKSNRSSALKALYILPIVGISLAVSAKTIVDYQYEEAAEPQVTAVKQMPTEPVQQVQQTEMEEQEEIVPVAPEDSIKPTVDPHTFIGDNGNGTKGRPLIVINGTILPETIPDNNVFVGDLLEKYGISRDNIVSINVLKDKSATEVYGDKGKNGVVVIKTEDGKAPQLIEETMQPVEGKHEGDDVFVNVEEMPEFKGGQAGLMSHLCQNIKYPALAQEIGLQGRVIVQFTIGKEGEVYDVKVIKSAAPDDPSKYEWRDKDGKRVEGPQGEKLEKFLTNYPEANQQLNAESIRCVKSTTGNWTSGKQKGEPVAVKYTIPIVFRLN